MKWKRWRNLKRLFPDLDMRGVDFVAIKKCVPIPPGGSEIRDKHGRRAVVHPMEDAGRRGLVIRYRDEPQEGETPDDTA